MSEFEELLRKAESGEEYGCHGVNSVTRVWYETDDEKYVVSYVDGVAESVHVIGQQKIVFGGET